MGQWRVGSKVPINVYEGDRPVCQCHNEDDAKRIVRAMSAANRSKRKRIIFDEVGRREKGEFILAGEWWRRMDSNYLYEATATTHVMSPLIAYQRREEDMD
jgi:hypothetical protein